MITYYCDRCGQQIKVKSDRFLLKMSICYPYEVLTINEDDLQEDYTEEIQDLVQAIEQMDLEELEKEVGVSFQFEICRQCREELIKEPLGKAKRSLKRRGTRLVESTGKVIKVDFRSET